MLLEWIARGLIVAAATTAVATIIYISGMITKAKLGKVMEEKGVKNAVIEKIDSCTNQVSLKDLENGTRYEVKGDGIDCDVDEGIVISCTNQVIVPKALIEIVQRGRDLDGYD